MAVVCPSLSFLFFFFPQASSGTLLNFLILFFFVFCRVPARSPQALLPGSEAFCPNLAPRLLALAFTLRRFSEWGRKLFSGIYVRWIPFSPRTVFFFVLSPLGLTPAYHFRVPDSRSPLPFRSLGVLRRFVEQRDRPLHVSCCLTAVTCQECWANGNARRAVFRSLPSWPRGVFFFIPFSCLMNPFLFFVPPQLLVPFFFASGVAFLCSSVGAAGAPTHRDVSFSSFPFPFCRLVLCPLLFV